MKIFNLCLLIIATLFTIGNGNAQDKKAKEWCLTDQYDQKLKTDNPTLIQEEINFHQKVREYIKNNKISGNKTSPYIIPVVIHNITDNGSGYVSKATIEAQLATLNEDFQRLNADASATRSIFLPYAMSMNIEFRLAHIDPSGKCTEGIVRKESTLSTNATDAVKTVSYWDSKKYFNIWVVNILSGSSPPSFLAGYAQFPWNGIDNTYGIVVDYNFFGGGKRTLTHEVGHCFGLLHTHGGGCGTNCSNSGDRICDTPPVSTSSFGCPTNNNTCSNDVNGSSPYGSNVVDQIENYMGYNSCQNMFTLEQKAAMEATLNSTSITQGLNQLNTTQNHDDTGVSDPYLAVSCPPISDFNYTPIYICEKANVSYSDNSYGGTATSWNWTFTGGTPTNSTSPSPSITYNTEGTYGATYQAGSSAGNGTVVTKNNIIVVSSLTANYSGSTSEGFEDNTTFNNDWRIENLTGGQTWKTTSSASYSGLKSLTITNIATSTSGETDELISPSYDLTSINTPILSFKVAYAKTSTSSSDNIIMYYSVDCGASWKFMLPLFSASSLSTVPNNNTGSFKPTNVNQWAEKTIDLSSLASNTNVRFKFAFTSGGGNNIYIDDINIGDQSVGIEDFSNISSFNVYPNPTNSSAKVSFNLTKKVTNLSIKVLNAVGQEVASIIKGQSFNIGEYTLKVDKEKKLSSGVYFIEFNADNTIKVEKLIVQ